MSQDHHEIMNSYFMKAIDFLLYPSGNFSANSFIPRGWTSRPGERISPEKFPAWGTTKMSFVSRNKFLRSHGDPVTKNVQRIFWDWFSSEIRDSIAAVSILTFALSYLILVNVGVEHSPTLTSYNLQHHVVNL